MKRTAGLHAAPCAILALVLIASFSIPGYAQNLIVNGDFESGDIGWSFGGSPYPADIVSLAEWPCCPHSSPHWVILGFVNWNTDSLWQQFTIPSNAASATLRFWLLVTTENGGSSGDYLGVSLRSQSGPIEWLAAWRPPYWPQDIYVQYEFDLTPWIGQTVVLHFTSGNDGSDLTGFAMDDVIVTTTGSACSCPCHGDPQCDSVANVQDVVQTVNVAFRGAAPVFDPQCPKQRTDVNCDGYSTVQDVVKVVNVAFRGANPATEFCDPCAP